MDNDSGLEQLSATQTANDPVARCDTITPIYPVRYAYANLFDTTVAAAEPPSVQTLLSATSLQQSQGYVVRLLREGWIYIREEGNNNYLHIFKYTRIPSGTGVRETFEKYLFKNGNNAQGGLQKDTSSGSGSYAFPFVSVGTSNISIAYSQHEWSANVIDRLHGTKSIRTKAMQQVNLVADTSGHSIDASQENLGKLIEDYRSRQDKILALNNTPENPDLASLSLDIFTTEQSYTINPEQIAKAIQSKLCYQEKANIIALHDPVGRQIEMAQAHAKLALWEQDYASLNIYPYMTGQFVDSFLNSTSTKVKEAAQDNINVDEHTQYWQTMQQQHDIFKARRKTFATIYAHFMSPVGSNAAFDQPGSLDTYFKHFFDYAPSNSQQADEELHKLANTSADIFQGLMASQEGKEALETMISEAARQGKDTSIENSRNTYGIIERGLIAITTQPHNEYDWGTASSKAIDKLLNTIGALWGEMLAWGQYSAKLSKRQGNKLTAGALQRVIDELIPGILKVLGLRIDTKNTIKFNNRQLGKILAQAIDLSVSRGGNKGLQVFQQAEQQLARGQRLFDWGNTQRATTLKTRWSLAQILVIRTPGKRFQFTVAEGHSQKIGLLFDGGAAGFSAFINMATLVNITNQSRFEQADPLGQGSAHYTALKFTTALAALTVDMMSVSRTALMAGQLSAKTLPANIATRLIPALNTGAEHVGRLLASKLAGGLIAIANFIGATVSVWDAVRASKAGNIGEAAGHAAVALGSAILFVGAAQSLAVAGGVSSGTGLGLPLGVVLFALSVIVGGVGLIYIFEKNPLENLLYQCFWGKSKDYAFWKWASESERIGVQRRLELAGQIYSKKEILLSYQIELQEFMNFLSMPQLSIERYDGSNVYKWIGSMTYDTHPYTLDFTLPNFQPGVSEVVIGVYSFFKFDEYSGQVETKIDDRATRIVVKALRDSLSRPAISNNGARMLSVRVEMPYPVDFFWYYQPMPNIIVPLRTLNNSGQLANTFIAGMKNEAPR